MDVTRVPVVSLRCSGVVNELETIAVLAQHALDTTDREDVLITAFAVRNNFEKVRPGLLRRALVVSN